MSARILVVDDDKNLTKVVKYNLEEEGHTVLTASTAEEGLGVLESEDIDLVLTDIRMPGMGGMELLRNIREERPAIPVILITAFAAIDSAVEAMKAGAVDYIPKPFNKDDLKYKVKKALDHEKLREENKELKKKLGKSGEKRQLIGRSEPMRKVYELIDQVADSDATVLITGPSGSGKELVARSIHEKSERAEGPWVAVNCAAIPRDLIESELFGHVKGAFTGAIQDRPGKFEQANGGTIFLDEVGDLDLALQPKILRALQEREVQRVGGSDTSEVDLRVLAATRMDLQDKVRKGEFREDLFYRLNVIPIEMPPLAERTEDVALLADHFLDKFGGREMSWSKGAVEALEKYDWPGNVRELENLTERIAVLKKGKGRTIEKEDLPPEILNPRPMKAGPSPSKGLRETEKELVEDALRRAGGNQSKAARLLGVPRHVLLYRIKKYGIEA